MPARDHNPHKRRLYLPVVQANGQPAELAGTHRARSVGCAQTARPVRRPEWLKVRIQTGPNYSDLKRIMRGLDLHTVCEEAGCPNIYECWEDREATFLILGMGERPEEVESALRDIAETGCDIVTIGQYLQPTQFHLPVDRWVTPEEFAEHKRAGESLGITHVEAGPLVRSSYHAGKQLQRALSAAGAS